MAVSAPARPLPAPGRGESAARLGPGEVHLWLAPLDAEDAEAARLWPLLSGAERARAAAFAAESDRRRFVAAHGRLRMILGACLDRAPAAVGLAVAPGGRPRLAREAGCGPDLRFNLSHADGRLAVALALGADLGVDIAAPRAGAEGEIIAAAFSKAERRALAGLTRAARTAAVRRAWARKEALAKALGTGFALAPARLSVGLGPYPVRPRLDGAALAVRSGAGAPRLVVHRLAGAEVTSS